MSATLQEAQVEALQRIAKALETLVLIETRKAQAGAKVFELAAQQRETEGQTRLRVLSDGPA